ncbi:MAG TPA: hypothetical protein VL523_00875 [Terriglobia bacterium]|nr:hypothetical protein [Terriglobia bacterium]
MPAAVDQMGKTGAELVFVYNAGSSLGARAFDFLHKAVSPGTYACNLCRITYGVFAEKQEWRRFAESLPYRATFLHKDEFQGRYPALAATPLPAIFLNGHAGSAKLVASAEEINRARSVDDLKTLLLAKVAP